MLSIGRRSIWRREKLLEGHGASNQLLMLQLLDCWVGKDEPPNCFRRQVVPTRSLSHVLSLHTLRYALVSTCACAAPPPPPLWCCRAPDAAQRFANSASAPLLATLTLHQQYSTLTTSKEPLRPGSAARASPRCVSPSIPQQPPSTSVSRSYCTAHTSTSTVSSALRRSQRCCVRPRPRLPFPLHPPPSPPQRRC